jgi:hypothetical protein
VFITPGTHRFMREGDANERQQGGKGSGELPTGCHRVAQKHVNLAANWLCEVWRREGGETSLWCCLPGCHVRTDSTALSLHTREKTSSDFFSLAPYNSSSFSSTDLS